MISAQLCPPPTAATCCQQGIWCPVCKHHFIRWTHPDISLCFWAGGRRVKNSVFHEFALPHATFFCWPAADSILIPPTFPIASLNRYTPNFSGVPQKLTWCQQFGLQIFPKWGDADICRLEMAVFRCFFGRNKFYRPNGRLSPIACHTYLESYGT